MQVFYNGSVDVVSFRDIADRFAERVFQARISHHDALATMMRS